MPSAAPRASVVLPVYYGEAYLDEALESVLDQTFTDWRVIAIDDGERVASRSSLERLDLANLSEPLILYRLHPDQVSLRVLEDQVRRAIAVRAAARIRQSSGVDPLDGVDDLMPEVVAQLCPDGPEIGAALEPELLTWATILVELGRGEQAEELVEQASRTLGPRAQAAFASARELRLAERSWT